MPSVAIRPKTDLRVTAVRRGIAQIGVEAEGRFAFCEEFVGHCRCHRARVTPSAALRWRVNGTHGDGPPQVTRIRRHCDGLITNLEHRAGADKELTHAACRLLAQIASKCRWHARYHYEPMQQCAWLSGFGNDSNVRRLLTQLCHRNFLPDGRDITGPMLRVGIRKLAEKITLDVLSDRLTHNLVAMLAMKHHGAKEMCRHGLQLCGRPTYGLDSSLFSS